LAVVIGSARPGRFGPVVASWATEQARQRGHVDIDTIVVVPEYNHSFPGELKTVIDRFKDEWAKKPVGFVSYGGLAGGLLAVEQLRLVFIEISAAPIRDTVSFHGARSAFDADGNPHKSGAARQALHQQLAQLHWWAAALRAARLTQPA
jgi:NAD(P)H-dependent FMN reductase